MKKSTTTTMSAIILLAAFLTTIVTIEAPRKPKKQEVIYVLPRVDEMPTNPNPLSI